ncbi:MAG TPA: hypothetical protein VL492_03130 [Methylovirgula sp.]|jgi:hypothetical protein|nr:hypothetical protein [Methylovirgula sp.]
MNAFATAIVAFLFIFGGVLVGAFLRNQLPEHHLSPDTKDVVRLGTGLVGTIAALVLGLMISSASITYNTQNTRLQEMTAKFILMDSLLAQYGPEAAPARTSLRSTVTTLADRLWGADAIGPHVRSVFVISQPARDTARALFLLSPTNTAQRTLRDDALHLLTDIGETRLLLFAERRDHGLPLPFFVVMTFWLTIIFMSFSLFSRLNLVAGVSLFVFAISAAAAIYMIIELSQPFTGLVRISDEPLRHALSALSP